MTRLMFAFTAPAGLKSARHPTHADSADSRPRVMTVPSLSTWTQEFTSISTAAVLQQRAYMLVNPQ